MRHSERFAVLELTEQHPGFQPRGPREGRRLDLAVQPNDWPRGPFARAHDEILCQVRYGAQGDYAGFGISEGGRGDGATLSRAYLASTAPAGELGARPIGQPLFPVCRIARIFVEQP